MTPSDRALLVYEAQGALARACMDYVVLREYYGDHRFKREMLAFCLAYGRALSTETTRT